MHHLNSLQRPDPLYSFWRYATQNIFFSLRTNNISLIPPSFPQMLSHHVVGREVAVSRLCCQPAGDSSADSDNNVVRDSQTWFFYICRLWSNSCKSHTTKLVPDILQDGDVGTAGQGVGRQGCCGGRCLPKVCSEVPYRLFLMSPP